MSSEDSVFDRIRIVLVEPRGPRNVGSTARAMKNFGLRDLCIVKADWLEHEECRQMGVGAHDLLDAARVVPTFDEAVADCTFLIGTTARGRHRIETSTPRRAAPRILEEAARGRTAVLFGREDFGLFAEELARCQAVISVETSTDRASLNLSQAVMLVAYELFQVAPESVPRTTATSDLGAVADDATLELLYRELVKCCENTGYLHEGSRLAIESSLQRILRAAPLQTRDTRALFGLARRVEKIMDGRAEFPGRSSGEEPCP